jgi:hypothetical protein
LQEVQRMRSAELQEAVQQQVLLLSLELPVFPHAVLYQQPLTAAAVVAQAAAKKEGTGASAAAAAAAAAGQVPWGPGSGNDIIRFHDPEVCGHLQLFVQFWEEEKNTATNGGHVVEQSMQQEAMVNV